MKRLMRATLLCAGLLAAAGVGFAQQQPRTGESVGQKVDEAVQSVKKGARNLANDVRESFERTKAAVHSMSVQSRIYGRIHWDKALNAERIEVRVDKDGVATLTGEVPSSAAQTKAVALANDTVGVTRTVDQLSVHTPAERSPAKKP